MLPDRANIYINTLVKQHKKKEGIRLTITQHFRELISHEIVATYQVIPAKGVSFARAAALLIQQATSPVEIFEVTIHTDTKARTVVLSYPVCFFEKANLSQLWTVLTQTMLPSSVARVCLVDVFFPRSYKLLFSHPSFGIAGLRSVTKIAHRPLLACTVQAHKKLSALVQECEALWRGGIDLVCEPLHGLPQQFVTRIKAVMQARDKVERETGQKKLYVPSIGAETGVMLTRADSALAHGCEAVLVDLASVGWSALHTLRATRKIIIYGVLGSHAFLHEHVSPRVLASFARLAGVDALHMNASLRTLQDVEHELEDKKADYHHVLEQDWKFVRTVMESIPIHSFDQIHSRVQKLGANSILQLNTIPHTHPVNVFQGAIAARQALTAALHNIPLGVYAEQHEELKRTLHNK